MQNCLPRIKRLKSVRNKILWPDENHDRQFFWADWSRLTERFYSSPTFCLLFSIFHSLSFLNLFTLADLLTCPLFSSDLHLSSAFVIPLPISFPLLPFFLSFLCLCQPLAWCSVCNRHHRSQLHAGRDFPKIL